jgi:electron transport complex protein RnfG
MGAKAKSDPAFAAQFLGLATDKPIKVSNDGGQIQAIAGATITSRAVSNATAQAVDIYKRLKPEIQEQVKSFN